MWVSSTIYVILDMYRDWTEIAVDAVATLSSPLVSSPWDPSCQAPFPEIPKSAESTWLSKIHVDSADSAESTWLSNTHVDSAYSAESTWLSKIHMDSTYSAESTWLSKIHVDSADSAESTWLSKIHVDSADFSGNTLFHQN